MLTVYEALIAWTPASSEWETAGQLMVGPLLPHWDSYDWTEPFMMTAGAAYVERQRLSPDEAVACLLADYWQAVGDGIQQWDAYREFLKIHEFRDGIRAALLA